MDVGKQRLKAEAVLQLHRTRQTILGGRAIFGYTIRSLTRTGLAACNGCGFHFAGILSEDTTSLNE